MRRDPATRPEPLDEGEHLRKPKASRFPMHADDLEVRTARDSCRPPPAMGSTATRVDVADGDHSPLRELLRLVLGRILHFAIGSPAGTNAQQPVDEARA